MYMFDMTTTEFDSTYVSYDDVDFDIKNHKIETTNDVGGKKVLLSRKNAVHFISI